MASYFWVGGSGTLDNAATTHIAASSGGGAGAGPVTSGDNITFDASSGLSSGTFTVTIAAGFTSTNFTFSGITNPFNTISLAGGVTTSGTLTISAATAATPPLVASNTLGTTRTWTAATIGALTNVDFRDITGAGAGTWSGTRVGNALGNSGITFTTPTTQTWSGNTTGSYSNAANWTSRVPLPQDSVVINGLTSGTITMDIVRMASGFDMTGSTGGTLTISGNTNPTVYGSVKIPTGITLTAANVNFNLMSRSSITLNCVPTVWGTIQIQGPGGTCTLNANLVTRNTRQVVIGSGNASFTTTFNANGFNVTSGSYIFSSATALQMGSGTWTAQSTGTVWQLAAGCTVSAGTSVIAITDTSSTSKTFAGGGFLYRDLTISGTGTGSVAITGANYFRAVTVGNPKTVTWPANTKNIVRKLLATGTVGNLVTFTSDSSGVAATLQIYDYDCDYVSWKDITAITSTGSLLAGMHSTLVSGTTGITASLTGIIEWFDAEALFHSNFFQTKIAATINNSTTTVTVLDPVPGGATSFWATLSARGMPTTEIVQVTNVVGTTWTIVRNQPGSPNGAQPHDIYDHVATGVANAAGFMGGDGNISVDLGGGRVMWAWSDFMWATAAGNSRSDFPTGHQMIAIQNGYDLSTATVTFYPRTDANGRVQSFFPDAANEDGTPYYSYLISGTMLDGKLYLFGLKNVDVIGTELGTGAWAVMVDNPTATPDLWHWFPLPRIYTSTPSTTLFGGEPAPCLSEADPGDGYVYSWTTPPGGSRAIFVCRYLRGDFKRGDIGNPQWWCGPTAGWAFERPDAQNGIRKQPVLSGSLFLSQGGFFKRSDGLWQATGSDDATHFQYTTNAAIGADYAALSSVGAAVPKYGQDLNYAFTPHPEQTYSGKAATDFTGAWTPGVVAVGDHIGQRPESYLMHVAKIRGT